MRIFFDFYENFFLYLRKYNVYEKNNVKSTKIPIMKMGIFFDCTRIFFFRFTKIYSVYGKNHFRNGDFKIKVEIPEYSDGLPFLTNH